MKTKPNKKSYIPIVPNAHLGVRGLGVEHSNKRHVSTDYVDFKRTQKLYRALAKHKKAQKYDEARWTQELASLRTDARGWKGLAAEEIDSVINWYCAHISQPGIPAVWNANVFVLRFGWLKDCMEADCGPYVKITASEKLQKKVLKLWLPGAKEEDVLKTMQLSINNYTNFYQTAQKLLAKFEKIKENSKDEKWLFFALKLRQKKVYGIPILWPDAERFVYDWFDFYIQEKLGNWDKWDGNVLKHVWHPEHKWFAADMRAWAAKHTRSERLWDDFVQMVKDENQTGL